MSNARRVATVTAVVVLIVLGVSTAAVAALRLVHRGEILPGVSVAGVDIGGMQPEDARKALGEVVEARASDPVHLEQGDTTLTVLPDEVGFHVDVDATLTAAQGEGRGGSILTTSWNHVRSIWTEIEMPLVLRLDRAALAARVDAIADQVDRDPFPGAIDADPETLEVDVAPPDDGVEVRRDDAKDLIERALRRPGVEEEELPVEVLPTTVEPADVEKVADRARAALEEPLELSAVGQTAVLSPSEVARLVALRARDGGDGETIVELHVPVDRVLDVFDGISERFEVSPTSARFDLSRTPPTTFDDQGAATWQPVPVDPIPVIPASIGKTFDPDLAAGQLADLFRKGVHQAELRLRDVAPELTTEQARDFELSHLLGTFTTYHKCCQNRVTNIHRLADMVDGAVVRAGDQFSINQISGERTCSKGFVADGMILNGEIVDVCGGGVSQFGTTTFNAAFFAGVPIDAYKAHSFYISRYPKGREATLNYPSPDIDVRFTNNTGNGLLVKTSYTSTSITVSIYGSSNVESVRSTLGNEYNHKPPSTIVRENKSLPPGSRRVVQSGFGGFTVQVDRIITYQDGDQATRTFTTVYVPQNRIIERNSSPPRRSAPPPPPPEQQEPSPPPEEEPPPPEEEQQPPPEDGG